ncbi:hypothetical protein AEAC466_14110 [Asticcacaulis sp. AC466]|uniref:DUF805 domain-containing protein n=1 Tax=Asticcacaulis sp. AC466 TaxID=1282362 RepID=UPI0003C3E2BF|nr:DUF805 domain-containing protein [Asticcacaulis sp. AC466]ESQ83379.1 hypothetical protein AEAC466_14110 [Asticcacaulis sp. AC466]
MEQMFLPLKRYAQFTGRSRRTEYWLWFLFQVMASLVFSILAMMIGDIAVTLNRLFSLAILLPTLAVAVRRFHDINRTGWWVLFPMAVFLVAMIVYLSMNGANFMSQMTLLGSLGPKPTPQQITAVLPVILSMMWILLAYLAAAIVTLVFNVMDGTPGPNRFGPDPKGRGNVNVF